MRTDRSQNSPSPADQPRSTRDYHRQRTSGFTLIELLVVISIISLIISLLLPSLASARRAAQRVACLATLRGVAQAAVSYSSDNEGALVGSPITSGIALHGSAFASGAAVQRWDFMGPLAELMGLGIPLADGNPESVARRFNELRSHPAFLCRSNKFLSTYYPTPGAPNAGTGRMVSLNTPRYQLMPYALNDAEANAKGYFGGVGVGYYNNIHSEVVPTTWAPTSTKLGVPANKVLMADGARFSTANSSEGVTLPDYDLSIGGAWGGAFSDIGPYSTFTRSWDRARAPGNGYLGRTDGRIWGFRHANGEPPIGAAPNAYKTNLIFHDGHGETQGDLEASNPHQWLPQGTLLGISSIYRDTRLHFNLRSGSIRIGP